MNTATLCKLNYFGKFLCAYALCSATALVRAEGMQHILFEAQAPGSIDSRIAAYSGAQTVRSGTTSAHGDSETSFRIDRAATQRAINSQLLGIEAISARQGPFAASLREPMLALGRMYQNDRQHDKAITMAERARHISRVNAGLNSSEQFPAMEMTIESYLALHDYQQAAEQQQALVDLFSSRYGANAPEVVPELVELGDMYFDAFERWRYELPGSNTLIPESGPDIGYADPQQMQPIDIAFACLYKAQKSYLESIRILLEGHDYTNPQLAQLENDVVATLFLQAHRRELQIDPVFFLRTGVDPRSRDISQSDLRAEKDKYYRRGEDSFRRLLHYAQQDPGASPSQTAEVLLKWADWHRLFGWHRSSETLYQQANAFMHQHESDDASMQRLLYEEVPLQLPSFLPGPYSRASASVDTHTGETNGYIDVAFTLDRYGRANDVEVLSRSTNATDAVESRLIKVLRSAPFRPQFGASDAEEAKPVTVRYLFAQY